MKQMIHCRTCAAGKWIKRSKPAKHEFICDECKRHGFVLHPVYGDWAAFEFVDPSLKPWW